MKITIVAGARPNFMKIAPITRAIEAARALGKVSLTDWYIQEGKTIQVWMLLSFRTST